jgi:DNA-binding CsgD family transcriptional regulator
VTGEVLEREAVSAAVGELLDRLRGGRGGALFVVGEPGVGKTTTLELLQRRTGAGVRVGTGRGDMLEASLAFGLVAQALGDLGMAWAPDREDVAASPAAIRADRFFGVLHWLAARADPPALLALDDLHWADADSLALLSFLCRRLGSLPVAVVATLRPWPRPAHDVVAGLVQAGYGTMVGLEPLSQAATDALLAARLGRDAARPLSGSVSRLCAGNPLLIELVATAAARGENMAGSATARAAAELPLARFAGLPLAGLRCAQAVSVLGVRFQPEVALAVAQLTDARVPVGACTGAEADAEAEVETALDALYRGRLVREAGHGWAEFVHPLFAQALYDDLAPPVRLRLHRRAFRSLLEHGRDEEAAEHAVRADLAGDREAVAVLERAGRAAAGAGALENAARYLRAAAGLAGGRAGVDLLTELGNTLLAAGRPAEAVPVYERLLEHPELPADTRVAALRMLARAYSATGAYNTADARFEQAVELAADTQPAAAIDALLDQAVMSRITAGPARSLLLVRRARDLSERADEVARHRVAVAHTWSVLQTGASVAADLTVVEASIRTIEADPLALLSGTRCNWGLLDAYAEVAILTEQFAEARRMLGPMLAAAEQIGAVEATATLSGKHAFMSGRSGPLDEALRHARRCDDLSELVPVMTARVGVAHAQILLLMGDADASRDWCARTERAVTARGELLALPWLWDVRAQLAVRAGRVEEACELYDRSRELSTELGLGDPCVGFWARHAIGAYLAADRADTARLVIRWLDRAVTASPCRWPRIASATGRAWLAERAGDQQQAQAHFRSALALHDGVELPFEHVETLLACGAYLRRGQRPAEARPLLAEALRIAEANQAGWLAGQAHEELAVAGGRRRRPNEAPTKLTAQERRVAQLAAAGHSNKEIAGRLTLSVKTVEFHLQQIYTKLRINSRRRLMAMMAGSGGDVDLLKPADPEPRAALSRPPGSRPPGTGSAGTGSAGTGSGTSGPLGPGRPAGMVPLAPSRSAGARYRP